MAISDGTKPDMGWRRAPLATAYAALRQGKARLKGPPGSRTGSGNPPSPVVVSFMVLALCALCRCYHRQQEKSQAPGAAAWVDGVFLLPRLSARPCQRRRQTNKGETRLDPQPRRTDARPSSSGGSGAEQRTLPRWACHGPDFRLQCTMYPMRRLAHGENGWCRHYHATMC